MVARGMPRHLRRRYEGAKYHVTNRGNGRERIFYRNDDYERFFRQLTEGLEKDQVTLYAYCLMPNHYHLFVETPSGNIDRFMGGWARRMGCTSATSTTGRGTASRAGTRRCWWEATTTSCGSRATYI